MAGLCATAGLGLHKGQAAQNQEEAAAIARSLGHRSLGFRFKENINQIQRHNWGNVNTDWVLDNIRNYC